MRRDKQQAQRAAHHHRYLSHAEKEKGKKESALDRNVIEKTRVSQDKSQWDRKPEKENESEAWRQKQKRRWRGGGGPEKLEPWLRMFWAHELQDLAAQLTLHGNPFYRNTIP